MRLRVGLIFSTLILISFALSSCERQTRLTVENGFSDDLTVYLDAISNSGRSLFGLSELGIAPADSTVELPGYVLLTRGQIGDIVELIAKDATGNVLWRRDWAFKDFIELRKTGWYVCVCPDGTSSMSTPEVP